MYRTVNTFLKKEQPLEVIKENFRQFNAEMYKQADYLQLFRNEIKAILDYAKKHSIKLAVASSSEYNHIVEVLQTCEIFDYFDVIYSGEFVKESKPHPEIYQNTLLKLNVLPENAVAIEDSSYGITAAQKAGITTIAYKETRMPIDQSHANHMGRDMKEIKEIISSIFTEEL